MSQGGADSNTGSKTGTTVQNAEARPAATVVLLRAAAGAPEVLLLRRHRGSSFMADAFVFPGGRVEPEDGSGEAAFAVAAARELREEAALEVAAAALVPFARWITPSAEPKRFDARFFIARAPAGQEARADTVETVEHLWIGAAAALERHGAGDLKLPPPTLRTLEELAPHASVEAALAWARGREPIAVQPKLVPLDDTLAIVLPWDPEYPSLPGEGLAIAADHPVARPPSRFVLRDGRWWGKPPG